MKKIYHALKRVIDFFWALFGLILISPLLLIIALYVKLGSGSPIFFKHERIGKGGKPFTVHKFRTMVVGAKEKEHRGLSKKELLTRPGRVLRPIFFDEFPQLVNVLKGEMAIIGPRAYDVDYNESARRFEGKRWNERLSIKPGMTGLGQIVWYLPRLRERIIDLLPEEDKPKKQVYLPFDLYYINHENPLLDVWILLLTGWLVVGSVIQKISGIPLIEKQEVPKLQK